MPSFLSLLRGSSGSLVLRNLRTGAIVAHHLLPAIDSASRRTGLLKHESLAPDTAMLIAPSNAIHTFFMKFPIDVAFVRKDGSIVKIRHAVPAWRMSAAWAAFAVIEMAAGSFARSGTETGDSVAVQTAD